MIHDSCSKIFRTSFPSSAREILFFCFFPTIYPHSLEKKKAYISSRESSEHSEIRLSNGRRGTRGVPQLSGSLVGDEGFEFSEPPSNYRTGGGLTGIYLRAAVQARMVLALAEGPKIHFKKQECQSS